MIYLHGIWSIYSISKVNSNKFTINTSFGVLSRISRILKDCPYVNSKFIRNNFRNGIRFYFHKERNMGALFAIPIWVNDT